MYEAKTHFKNDNILNSDGLYHTLKNINLTQLNEVLGCEQYEVLKGLVLNFQDDWMDNAMCFFHPIVDCLELLGFDICVNFPTDFLPWYLHQVPDQKLQDTIAGTHLFSAPKLAADGTTYNCLLSKDRAEHFLQQLIQCAEKHQSLIPDESNPLFPTDIGLEVLQERIWAGIGTEKVLFNAIIKVRSILAENGHKDNVLCLRRFGRYLQESIKTELSREVYLTNCFEGKLADLLDRDEAWDEFVIKNSKQPMSEDKCQKDDQ